MTKVCGTLMRVCIMCSSIMGRPVIEGDRSFLAPGIIVLNEIELPLTLVRLGDIGPAMRLEEELVLTIIGNEEMVWPRALLDGNKIFGVLGLLSLFLCRSPASEDDRGMKLKLRFMDPARGFFFVYAQLLGIR